VLAIPLSPFIVWKCSVLGPAGGAKGAYSAPPTCYLDLGERNSSFRRERGGGKEAGKGTERKDAGTA